MVRTLKEQMARDRFIFLNPKEFGEEMLIDGVPCLGSWDEEQDQPVKQFFGSGYDNVFGVFTRERVLYYAAAVGEASSLTDGDSNAMPSDGAAMETPVPMQELDINGDIWTVRDASPEGGIIKVTLYRNES